MALVLYTASAIAMLWISSRCIRRIEPGSGVVLLLLPFCLTGYAMLTGQAFGPFDLPYATEPLQQLAASAGAPTPYNGILSDLYTQMIPWRHALQVSLAHHQWPLWNKYILSGTLLAAAAQPAAYSPFTLLSCLLPIGASVTYTGSITFLLAALGGFLFAREIGCGVVPSLAGAAAWMSCGMIAFFVLWAESGAWVFLPFVLLGTRRCVRDPGVASSTLLMIALALLLFAGHPETTVHIVFIGALYGVFELVRNRRRTPAVLVSGIAAGIVALLLSAIYLLPILDTAPQSIDYQFRRNVYAKVPHGVPPMETAVRVVIDFFPFLHGRKWLIEGLPYLSLDTTAVGSIALALAVYALLRSRRRETWFFAGVAVFGILMGAGWRPLAYVVQHVPLMDVTLNERFVFAGAFALAMLAAIALDEFSRRGGDRALGWTLAGTAAVLSAGTLLLIRSGLVMMEPAPPWVAYAIFGEIGLLAIAAPLAFPRWPPTVTAMAILMLLIGQRTLEMGGVYPTVPPGAIYPPIPILEPLKTMHQPFRIVGQSNALIPATGAFYGLEDARGYDALTLERYRITYDLWCIPQAVWFNRVDDLTRPFLSFLNVRYAISSTVFGVPPGWHTVAEQPGARLLENERVLPRAFVPEGVTIGPRADDLTLPEMGKLADFRQNAWIEAPLNRQQRANGPGSVSIDSIPYGFRLGAVMENPGWIVVSEPAWHGWRAYIDGRRVQMQIANEAFLGIYTPAGRHQIRLVYWPESFVAGRAISGATLLALFCAFGIARIRKRAASSLPVAASPD